MQSELFFGASFWELRRRVPTPGPVVGSRPRVPPQGPDPWSRLGVPPRGPDGAPRLVSTAAAGARFKPSPGHVRMLAPMCAEHLPSRRKRAGFQPVPETGAGAAGAAALTSGRWVGPATRAVELGASRSTAAASGSAGRRPDSRRLARRLSKRLEPSAAALPSGHRGCWGMPGPEGEVGWAGGRRAASLSRAPSNRAVCNWVATHTAGRCCLGAWLFGSPSDPPVRNTQKFGRRRRPMSPSGGWRPVRVGGCGGAGPAVSWRR